VSTSSDNGTTNDVVTPSLAVVPHAKTSIPMLAILVSYNNITIDAPDATWSEKLFGTNPHQLNNYYAEISNSKFQFTKANESNATLNDGVVSVHLNYNHPNTSVSSTSFDSMAYPDLKDALVAVDAQVDFSNFDSDANGVISSDELVLTFIIAGYEDAYEGTHVTNGIWAHQYCMNDSANIPTLDSVSLMDCSTGGKFALFGEKHNLANPHDATIGIIAHELGHAAFAFPDLYNTAGSYGGIGYFGLMGSGLWARQDSVEFHGNTPTHVTAWNKVYTGWVTPRSATGSTTLSETASASYDIIKIPINSSSYYLLENRNNSGYDKGLFSLKGTFNGGMALWKIDETKLSKSYFDANTVNADTANKGVDLVEAANATLDTLAHDAGDEKALFYLENVSSYESSVTGISSRGSLMTLTIQ